MGNYSEIQNINTQEAPTKSQITNNRPDIIKNSNVLNGYFASSMNGGHVRTICYAPIMAGTKVSDYRIRTNVKLLTPKTPVYQKLKLILKAFFVPNSRVWKNSEKFISQKGGATEIKIKEMPNIGGKQIPLISAYNVETDTRDYYRNYLDTDLFRDSWISAYLPRYQSGLAFNNQLLTLPKAQALAIRGWKAIYNDYLRNKEYDTPYKEYNTDEYTQQEWEEDLGYNVLCKNLSDEYEKIIVRGKRQNSYYTDYRTQLLGEDTENPFDNEQGQPMLNLTEWTKRVNELRQQSENSQLNDWDIIAKIRGSRKLTQGKVQLLGTKVVGLNYQSVTQSTYNTKENITEEFQELGSQGAYSYTEVDLSMFQMQEFVEDGYIHVVAQISADTVFEVAFDRMNLNVRWDDLYRPDLKDLKEDVLYEIEKCATRLTNEDDLTKVTGYKRKFSEYFKLPNCIQGDLSTNGYYIMPYQEQGIGQFYAPVSIEDLPKTNSKRSFQFFESDDKETAIYMPKKIWKDYTDIALNENRATMDEVIEVNNIVGTNYGLRVKGDNQAFMLGMQIMVCDMEIDPNIKNNYTVWGEK